MSGQYLCEAVVKATSTNMLFLQAAPAMTDTLPSFRIKDVFIKSVCKKGLGTLALRTGLTLTDRVCLQGDYGSKHHISRCQRQELCGSNITEESSGKDSAGTLQRMYRD